MPGASGPLEGEVAADPGLEHHGVADVGRRGLLERPQVAVDCDEVGELARHEAADVGAPDRLVRGDREGVDGLGEA